jgi:hypothetical protein
MIFLAACLAIGAATAAAQHIPMYSEVYNEKTGALEYKAWESADGYSWQKTVDGSIQLFRRDSMKFYLLDAANKTARTIPFSAMSAPNTLAGRVVQTGRSEKRELVEAGVDVEGYPCDYYVIN